MNGVVSEFGEGIHPDIENRLPALVNWVCRNAEDDIVATMRAVAERRGEVLISDTVRMVLVSVERIKDLGTYLEELLFAGSWSSGLDLHRRTQPR